MRWPGDLPVIKRSLQGLPSRVRRIRRVRSLSYLKAMAEVTRSDVHHGQAAVSAQAIRVDHFTTRLPTNRFSSTPFRDPTEPITIAFWLRANVSGAGGPLVKGQFDSSVWLSKPIRLRKGKWTSNWWGAGGVCGEFPPSDPCHDGVQNPPIQITEESAEASLSGGTFWSIRLGNKTQIIAPLVQITMEFLSKSKSCWPRLRLHHRF